MGTEKHSEHRLGKENTIREAREFIASNTKQGVHCPCCNAYVKTYKRSLNSSNAVCLLELFRISETYGYRFWHITDLAERSSKFAKINNGGEFARMRHWGLIVEQPKSDMDRKKKTSGYWMITEKGKKFAQGRLRVKKFIIQLNNQVRGFDGEFVTIRECLDEKFTYEGIMGETKIEQFSDVTDDGGQLSFFEL